MDDIVPLRDCGLLRTTTVRDIAAIEAEAPCPASGSARQDRILILRRMKEWEDILPCPPFVRIDRSLLVNLSCVAKVVARDRTKPRVFFTGLSDPISITVVHRLPLRLRTRLAQRLTALHRVAWIDFRSRR